MDRTEYRYHNSVRNCVLEWGDNPDSPYQPAGRAMAKALKSLGMSRNEGNSDRVFITVRRTIGAPDYYTLFVKDRATAERVAKEVWKDSRVETVDVNGTAFPKRTPEEELEAFKREVYEVAARTKRTEGWCDGGFEAAMKELGIEIPKRKTRVVLEFEVPADVNPDDFDSVKKYITSLGFHWEKLYDSMKTVEPIEG